MDTFSMHDFCMNSSVEESGLLFTHLVKILVAAQYALTSEYPKNQWDNLESSSEFDFIIVGAGSAGSVVANRLSENPNWNVLLIEAGGTPTPESEIPSNFMNLIGSKLDWNYKSEKSNNSCLGMKYEQCLSPQGKALGGDSAINAQFYIRGNAEDYNEWARLGNQGWDYESVLNYFKKSEKLSKFKVVDEQTYSSLAANKVDSYAPTFVVSSKYHSVKGLQNVQHYGPNPCAKGVKKILWDALIELGENIVPDINGKNQLGFAEAQSTTVDGRRVSTAKSFLNSVKNRRNLMIVQNAMVHKLILQGKKVVGVRVFSNNVMKAVYVRKEVILSAGAYNSPRLLMLSGIGPKDHLESLAIPVVHELNGIGQNLQDHLVALVLPFALNSVNPKLACPKDKAEYYYEFLLQKKGPFTSSSFTDLIGFVNTQNNSSYPDIQFLFLYIDFNETESSVQMSKVCNFKPEITKQFTDITRESGMLILLPLLLRPKSLGRVELRSSNPTEPPRIFGNYLDSPEDIETLIRGVEFAIKFSETKSFRETNSVLKPIHVENCSKHVFRSRGYWECLIRHLSTNLYHPVGTCKMSPPNDPLAVVDSKLKVYGITNLRVVDASIMPVIPRGNTNAASIMIGEKAADYIKEDWPRQDNETNSSENLQSY